MWQKFVAEKNGEFGESKAIRQFKLANYFYL